jgi:hypothetical protein
MNQGMCAEGANAEYRVQDFTIERTHPLLGIEAGGTEIRLATTAEAATTTRGTPRKNNVIAYLMLRNARPDGLDDARAFMSQ